MTTENSTNIAKSLLLELDALLLPVTTVASSADPVAALRRFLRQAGWHITADLDPTPIVTSIAAFVESMSAAFDGIDPDDLGEFLEAIDSIRTLIVSVDGLISAIAAAGSAVPTDDELAVFGEDVLQTLLTRWIYRKPVVGELATVLGLVEIVEVAPASVGGFLKRSGGVSHRFRPATITDFISDPIGHIKNRIVPNNWANSADAAATNMLLYQHLGPLMQRLNGTWDIHPNMMASQADLETVGRVGGVEVSAPVADEAGRLFFGAEFEFFSRQDSNAAGEVGPAVELAPFGGYEHTFEQLNWSVTLGVLIALGGVDVGDSPPLLRFDSGGVDAKAGLDARVDVGAHIELNSVLGGRGTRLEFGALDIGGFFGVTGGELDGGFSVVASTSRIVLSAADLGMDAVADFETTVEFDLGIKWSNSAGLALAGSASLEVEFSEGIDIGGIITLNGLRLRAAIAEAIGLSIVTDVGVNLGPVTMAFEDVGLGLEISFPESGGNLGGAHLGVAIEPPKGVGVSVDAGAVSGGGFLYLDYDNGEYAGVLELSFPALSLSLKAVGIFTTQLPGGADGYALLLLVYTEFPAVQLGYGFTLNGVGGVLGLQHGVSTEALQEGMRTGSLDNVLFPEDPVGNAPALLSDLRSTFPISQGSLTFGPALQIGWGGGIVTISLGLILQFDNIIGSGAGDPSIARIVLLGQLKVELPPIEDAPELVKLLVDIIGYYDFEEKELGIDARLRDSHLAGLPLTGSLVVRARFGEDPSFILAIGGFHPRFTDLPPGLPPQDRLGVQLKYGIVTVQITCYTAITSNSFQIGADASLLVKAGNFKVEAYLGFDALFIFQPRFHFVFDFRVGAAISWKKWELLAIRVNGSVSGPGRWELSGSASISILFFTVNIDFDVAWGEAPVEELPTKDVLPEVIAALSEASAWSAALPDGRMLVTLRQHEDDVVVAHPLGRLDVRQTIVPFGINVEKVGNSKPADFDRFDLTEITIGDQSVSPTFAKEHFARGEYFDLSEDDKLTTPSFERFDAGVSVGTTEFVVPTESVAFDPIYETRHPEMSESEPTESEPTESSRLPSDKQMLLALFGAAGRTNSAMSARLGGDSSLQITVRDSPHALASKKTFKNGATTSNEWSNEMTYTAAMQTQASEDDDDELIVVEAVEVQQ